MLEEVRAAAREHCIYMGLPDSRRLVGDRRWVLVLSCVTWWMSTDSPLCGIQQAIINIIIMVSLLLLVVNSSSI